MPKEIMRVLYTSTHDGISEHERHALSEEAHGLHAKYGMNGLLVVGDEDFLGILEGELIVVTAALTRIAKDPRHHSLDILFAGSAKNFIFQDWKVLDVKKIKCADMFTDVNGNIPHMKLQETNRDHLENIIVELAKAV